MIILLRWLIGYVDFSFSKGFVEGFINDCFSQDIPLRSLDVRASSTSGKCPLFFYKELHKIAYKNGGVVYVSKRHGLPFLLKPLKNRFGVFVGIFLFVVIICFLNSFVWRVEITGNQRITSPTIINYLADNRLKSGVMWGSIDRSELSMAMMRDFDDIAWVHINKDGAVAKVEIDETRTPPIPNEKKLKNIKVERVSLSAIAYRTQSRVKIIKTKSLLTLHLFSLNIPLYITKSPCDLEEAETKMLTINSTQLPIGYTVTHKKWLSSTKYDLTDQELLALANKKLTILEQREFENAEIVNKNPVHKIDNDKCIINCSYIIRYS